MSVENGISAQSARLYFKQKDHKDLYGNLPLNYPDPQSQNRFTGFHHMLYMQGKDPSRYDIIWRKQYPDKYFLAVTQGSAPTEAWGGRSVLCYPKQKTGTMGFVSVTDGISNVGNHVMYLAKAWSSMSPMIATEDGRMIKFGPDVLPNVNYPRMNLAVRGGFIMSNDWSPYETYACPIVEDAHHLCADAGEVIRLGTPSEIIPNASSDFGRHGCSDGKSPYVFFSKGENIAPPGDVYTEYHSIYRYYNMETGTFSSTYDINLHYSSGWRYVGVNGKDIFTYTFNEVDEHHYYVSCRVGFIVLENGVFSRRSIIPESFYSVDGPCVRYNNGVYYIYLSGTTLQTRQRFTHIYTTTDFTSFTRRVVTGSIIMHAIRGEETYEIHFDSAESGTVAFGSGGQPQQTFFENNKMIYPQDRVFVLGIPSGWSNTIICYFDNPWLQDSPNNFYIKSSANDASYGFSNQDMARKYYHMNGGI